MYGYCCSKKIVELEYVENTTVKLVVREERGTFVWK
jgi:hypothetical protein